MKEVSISRSSVKAKGSEQMKLTVEMKCAYSEETAVKAFRMQINVQ